VKQFDSDPGSGGPLPGDRRIPWRPTELDELLMKFVDAVFEAVCGDADGARRLLASLEDPEVLQWFDDEVMPRAEFPIVSRQQIDAGVLDRAGFRCQCCSSPLVDERGWERLQQLIGVGALPGHAESVGPDSMYRVARLLTRAFVVRRGRRRWRSPGKRELVAACILCAGAGPSSNRPRHRRRRAAVTPWQVLGRALESPAQASCALVRRAFLLDGSTLDLSGVVIGVARGHGFTLHVRSSDSEVASAPTVPIEIGPLGTDIAAFQVHVSLLGLLAVSPPPDRLDIELRGPGGEAVPLVTVANWDVTANGAVMEPIPSIADLGLRLRFDSPSGVGLGLHVDALPALPEVAGVSAGDGFIDIELVSSPISENLTVRSVWVQPRAARNSVPRQELERVGDGVWRLRVEPHLVEGVPSSGAAGDVWASWRHRGAHSGRIGRRRSDLLDLRSAVRLPSVTVGSDATRVGGLRVTPYFADSRHLSLKVTPLADQHSNQAG
jgi:hypothetical protein